MIIISISNAKLSFGHKNLLDNCSFSIEKGEKIGLIGRNGCGKSSMLKVLAGKITLDDGLIKIKKNLNVSLLEQEPDFLPSISIYEAVSEGTKNIKLLLNKYEKLTKNLKDNSSISVMETLSDLQTQIDLFDGWNINTRIKKILQKLNLQSELKISSLSGGEKKRVALAKALVSYPDLLLLDEPTNHLDIYSIFWLEEFLKSYNGTLLFITHDRRFLNNLATKIIDIDRGVIRSYPGNFDKFKKFKANQISTEIIENKKNDKFLAKEEIWIKKGVEARRSRNEGRVQRLKKLREERNLRKDLMDLVKMEISNNSKSSKIIAELKNIEKSFNGERIINNFSSIILRGDKIGIIGANGIGKTTLLKIILGHEKPDSGIIKLGKNIELSYFDQLRNQLCEESNLKDTVAPGSDWIEINGKSKHVVSYLNDFLFPSERIFSPVKSLSGGEKNRLLLASLFAKPSNVLIMDEPTNDLDIETLELLEQLISDYVGTVFLVSHDRSFIDNVATQIIIFEKNGILKEYIGGYSDWEHLINDNNFIEPQNSKLAKKDEKKSLEKSKKLSYNEKRELEVLPEKIMNLEQEQLEITKKLNDINLYKNKPEEIKKLHLKLKEVTYLINENLDKWESIESKKND
mgnify:CR=1 FL=1